MPYSRTTTLRLIRYTISIVIVVIIVGYAIWRSLNYARGPVITIDKPLDGSSASSSAITISGSALRINKLTMDGNAISINEQGDFQETIALFPGLNIVTFAADDQFGRHTEKILRLYGLSPFPISTTSVEYDPNSTTTPPQGRRPFMTPRVTPVQASTTSI